MKTLNTLILLVLFLGGDLVSQTQLVETNTGGQILTS